MKASEIKNPSLTPEMRDRLLQQRARLEVLQLHGSAPGGKPWNTHLIDEIDATLKDETPEADKAKFIREAIKDPSKRSQLNALRIETTQNYVLATADFASFFNVITLGEADVPAIQNETMHPVKVSYMAEDGQQVHTKIVKPQQETLVDLTTLTTDKVSYTLRDIYRGRVADVAQKTFNLAYDLSMKLDELLLTHLTAQIGSFDLTNVNKAARTFVPHPSVRSGVLPTSNALQIGSVSGSTKFGFGTLDKIIDYAARFARCFADGDLQPTGDIIVPAHQIIGIADGVTVTASKQNDVAQEILRNGYFSVSYLGYTWRFIPNNVIAPGYCYPKFNKPLGNLYLKPSMDVAGEETDEFKNMQTRWQSMVLGIATPGPRKVNMARVEFNTSHS